MNIRTSRRIGAAVASAAVLAVAGALASPAVASAADGVAPPTLTIEQGAYDGGNVQVTTDDPNGPITACLPIRVAGDTALRVLADYAADDMPALVDDLKNGDVAVGDAAYDASSIPFVGDRKSPVTTTWQVDDGVYAVVGVCKQASWNDIGSILDGDYLALLDPATTAFTLAPLIVPDGIGSIAPAADFGSLLLQTPEALSALSSENILGMLTPPQG